MAESSDQSHLDSKYFIDPHVFNCPFCNRRHIRYNLRDMSAFHRSNRKTCFVYYAQCHGCGKISMHLSYLHLIEFELVHDRSGESGKRPQFKEDIESSIFYSVPTSFFVIDERVPAVIRALITEAEGSQKMNFLTGASACARKAIYELLVKEEAEGEYYEDKIKSLKTTHPNVDATLFDVLSHIQDMTSEKVHEQSWPKWESQNLTLIIETLKTVLYEIYVLPQEKSARSGKIQKLLEQVRKGKAPEEEGTT